MKLIFVVGILSLCVSYLEALTCNEGGLQGCEATEYNSYVDCMRRRLKRSLDCNEEENENEDTCEDFSCCDQCDCNYCNENTCRQSCTFCCKRVETCSTNRCCHKSCHARCKSSSCRTDCRKTCTDKVKTGKSHSFIVIAANNTTPQQSPHNITTIINLQNVVNNTNIIDIPVQVNNTNINNITLGSLEHKHAEGIAEGNSCCQVVSPRQCVRTDKYPYVKCFHLRKKECGTFCHAPIMHAQPHEICEESNVGTSCHQQVIYIPQPQPRCSYKPSWPYVSCGIQQQQSCSGCYGNYGSGGAQGISQTCHYACYDDGFGMGPYYRQGPFYRPGYSPVPSCYQIGNCPIYGFGAYGSYGGYAGGYNSFPVPPGGYPGGFGAPAPPFNIPGLGYPPSSYENNFHVELDPQSTLNQRTSFEQQNETNNEQNEIPETPPAVEYPQYQGPYNPDFSAYGYPFSPPVPHPYYVDPEVSIEGSVSSLGRRSRYAQITIDNTEHKQNDHLPNEKEFVDDSSYKVDMIPKAA